MDNLSNIVKEIEFDNSVNLISSLGNKIENFYNLNKTTENQLLKYLKAEDIIINNTLMKNKKDFPYVNFLNIKTRIFKLSSNWDKTYT